MVHHLHHLLCVSHHLSVVVEEEVGPQRVLAHTESESADFVVSVRFPQQHLPRSFGFTVTAYYLFIITKVNSTLDFIHHLCHYFMINLVNN